MTEYSNLSDFKKITIGEMIEDKKYLITCHENNQFCLYIGYYDGMIETGYKNCLILKNVTDIYNNKINVLCLYSRSVNIYSFNGKKDISQNNMENRALNTILKKITGDQDFDINMKIAYTQIENNNDNINNSDNDSDNE
jgi:hypothetical protein